MSTLVAVPLVRTSLPILTSPLSKNTLLGVYTSTSTSLFLIIVILVLPALVTFSVTRMYPLVFLAGVSSLPILTKIAVRRQLRRQTSSPSSFAK